MKKLIVFLFVLLAIPIAVFAQDVPAPPSNWGDVIFNFQEWFLSFGGVVVLTAFVAAFFNGLLKLTKGFLKQLCAWVVAIILLVGSDLVNFGYAKDFPILLAVIHGVAAGLASNGVFDIPFVKSILDKIEGWFVKE
jgi:hypothetical protein